MNRLIAQLFSLIIGAVHLIVLGGLILALFLDHPLSAELGDVASDAIGGVPPIVGLLAALVVYILIMGVVSTLISINTNLERMAQQSEARRQSSGS